MATQQVFGSLNSRYLTYFRDIHGAAFHLLNIINDILDAVNVDSGEVRIASRPLSVSKVLAEAKTIVLGRADQQRIDMTSCEVSNDLVVIADPVRLRQIFVNLLANAIKFTNTGGSVGIDTAPCPDNNLAITVWDTGIGIPVNQHDRIFESFHQVSSDLLNSPTEGTGLGLTISRQLAQRMGGDLTVDSEPGRGASFTVRLPRAVSGMSPDDSV